jgi:hypothetical protein
MVEPILNATGVVTSIRQGVPAGVSKHVSVDSGNPAR